MYVGNFAMVQAPEAQPAAPPRARPVVVTILCIFGFLGIPLTVWMIFSGAVSGIAPWYPALLGASTVIGLICLIGLWMMRKWAVYLYAAFTAVSQVILFATGIWTPMALIIPVVFVAVMAAYLPRMN